ncbi:MAG: hypothetical protein ABTR27_14795 [Candidatus Competibacter phosphatis]
MSEAFFATPPVFNPARWFWLADDGRVYSSAAAKIITAKNKEEWAEYQRFRTGAAPTPWPRDGDGNQTATALSAVLTAAGQPPVPTK